MKIVIDIPNSLYANLGSIKRDSSACGRILECVRNGRKFDSYQYNDGFLEGYKQGIARGKVIAMTQLAYSILEKWGDEEVNHG